MGHLLFAVVGGSQLVRAGYAALIQHGVDAVLLHSGATVGDLPADGERPELVVYDVARIGERELAQLGELSADVARVVVIGPNGRLRRTRAVQDTGAAGYVCRDDPGTTLLGVIHALRDGEPWADRDTLIDVRASYPRPRLSEREATALALYVSGLELQVVADRMGIKLASAKTFIDRIRDKYQAVGRPASSRLELHRAAVVDGTMDLISASPETAGPPAPTRRSLALPN